MKKKAIIAIVLVLIAGAITIRLVSNKRQIDVSSKTATNNTGVIIPVNSITVSTRAISNNLVKTGTLIPFQEADITSVSGGKIVSIDFHLGSQVTKGAVLARLDNSGLQLNLQAAQLAEDKAQKDYKRFQALLAGEATTEMNYQDAKLNFQNAQNQIAQIQKQMSDNLIKAPLSGQVVSKIKEVGEFASPGMVLGHIVDVSRLKVEVMVSEDDVYKLKNNAPVSITTDVYPGVTFDGKITFISQSGDAVHNYQVEVLLDNKKDHPLKAGSFANVNFNQESRASSIVIPKSALIQSLEKPMVYVIQNGLATVRPITVGASAGNDIEVAGGLKEGEQVIISGLVNVSNGTKVKVVKE